MTVVVDTSVAIKWFHDAGEAEVTEARAVLDAHVRGTITVGLLDLGLYELGNVLSRSLRWPGDRITDQIDDVITICGPVLQLEDPAWRVAANLAATHGLTFYDAAWVAAARQTGAPLVTADAQLLASGLGESATSIADRLGLSARTSE